MTTPAEAVEILNRVHAADPTVLPALIAYRVPCNRALADDPTVQVGIIAPCSCGGKRWVDDEGWEPEFQPWDGKRSEGDGLIPCGFCNFAGWDVEQNEPVDPERQWEVGLLGLVNGLFGARSNGWGWIGADFEGGHGEPVGDLLRFTLLTDADVGVDSGSSENPQ